MFAPVSWSSKESKTSESKKNEPMATQNKETLMWTGGHQEAFDLLKSHLISTPALGYPEFSQPFKLETNVSLQGMGTVLLQKDKKVML